MASRDPPDRADNLLGEDTVVDHERPRPQEMAEDTERIAAQRLDAADESLPSADKPTVKNVAYDAGRARLAEMPTTVSRRTRAAQGVEAPAADEDDDDDPDTIQLRTGPAGQAGENTLVDQTAPSVEVRRGPDVDDVFTSGVGKAVREDPHANAPRTEQFRLDELQLPPRLADAAQRVELHLGGYHVHHFLGAGGMASVYLARAPGLDTDVVIKRVRKERLSDPRNVKRFQQEARIALTLQHPHIVRTLDYAEDGGEHFLVMEFLDGYDLRHLAKRLWNAGRALPLEPILLALAHAARGLDYAHRRGRARTGEGIVHRDVSPENLFLTADGFTKVLDFGLALDFDSERFSATGEVMGKVPYLSPEAVRSQPLDGRSDIFALCVTAWWLLTGRRPFGRSSPLLTLKAILDEDPPPLPKMNPRLPPALSAILRKGLEKDPRWRYARAADLADALEEAAGDARLPPDATRLLVRQVDRCPRPPERVSAPFPPTVPWSEWSA